MPAFYIDDKFSGSAVDMARFANFDQDSYDPLTSYFFMRMPYLEMGGSVQVQVKWEHRPDLVSYHIYGVTDYWWILLMYNDLIKNEEVLPGMVLSYPKKSAIDDYIFGAKKRLSFVRCKDKRIASMAS